MFSDIVGHPQHKQMVDGGNELFYGGKPRPLSGANDQK